MLLKLIQFYRRIQMGRYGWHGNYSEWSAAIERSKGYNEDLILQKVLASTLKVKNNEGVYERDGMLMDHIEYSWPLLTHLLTAAIQNELKLHIIDFGGSLGSSYFQNLSYLQHIKFRWDVVEQKNYVEAGNKYVAHDQLQFHESISIAIEKNGKPDVLLLGCVLPYLQDPYQSLHDMIAFEIPLIIIENTYFHDSAGERLTIQHVPPEYYEASYPAWFLDYEKLKAILSIKYRIRQEYVNDQFLYLDGRKINYKGVVAELRSNVGASV